MPNPSTPPLGRPPPKRPYKRLWGAPPIGRAAVVSGPPIWQAAYGRLLPPWIPQAIRACSKAKAFSRPVICAESLSIRPARVSKSVEDGRFGGGRTTGGFPLKAGQLPKVLPVPAIPYPFMPCRRASPIDDNDFISTNKDIRKCYGGGYPWLVC
jgi:hypothetical protein